ncbi:amino acid biosynthesis protein [Pseudomonas cichorii]|uniref:hypothetical protein n=1 Tax=Pseudomonas cichorii TaxID=36746 RepID=UPI0019106FB9|nr:hypothetical protein [Pseudomonas cichorii]GFM89769.1 amino acid biosynthesis protein [Pseudomonas cichorii]
MCETIATLGPVGTDSHKQAEQLGARVSLHDTFHAAVEHAKTHGTKLLVPAGFRENRDGKPFSWVDFHFENIGTIELEKVWFEKTMPMVLLHKSYHSIAIHPSTSSLVPELERYEHVNYTRSKVEAYQLFAQGKASAVIASTCLTNEESDRACIKAQFNPTMVWCLYRMRSTSS